MWCIDQGLTFHTDNKLRTVIWDFQGQPVAEELVEQVVAFGRRLEDEGELRSELQALITPSEYERLLERVALIERLRVYPSPPAYRPYPWPMI
jgi:hypothetical protein